jgi:hypothetical protein
MFCLDKIVSDLLQGPALPRKTIGHPAETYQLLLINYNAAFYRDSAIARQTNTCANSICLILLTWLFLINNKHVLLPNSNSIMKNLFWIFTPLILIIGTILFAIGVTNNPPENPFKKYSIAILIGLLAISGYIRQIYRRLYK